MLEIPQRLELLNTWLDCSPVAGDLLWYTPGLVETSSLNEHYVRMTIAYCWKLSSAEGSNFYRKMWIQMDETDREAFSRDVVLGWQTSIKNPENPDKRKRRGDFSTWLEFLAYLNDRRENIKDKLKSWNKARGANVGTLSEVVELDNDLASRLAADDSSSGGSPLTNVIIEECNHVAQDLITSFRVKLNGSPKQLLLLECVLAAYQLPLFALDFLENDNVHYPMIRRCAMKQQNMTQGLFNTHTKRLRQSWMKFRTSDEIVPRWQQLYHCLGGEQ